MLQASCAIGCSVQATTADDSPLNPDARAGGPGRPTEEELQRALIRLGRGLRAAYRTDPAAVGVVYHLASSGPMRVSTLAEALILDISTTSRHVTGLEAGGLLTREPDPGDRRATLITLTEAGREFLANALDERVTKLRAATDSWPRDDIDSLIRLINRLADDMSKEPQP
jgi:DNA-binding MarR family transcriptional regulator